MSKRFHNSGSRRNSRRAEIKAKIVAYIIDFRVQQKSKCYVIKPISKNKRMPKIDRVFFWDYDIEAMDFDKAYRSIIGRIVERGGQEEIDEIIRFYGYEKVIRTIRDEIHFLPNYGIDHALKFFPELKKEEMHCYLNRKDKPYQWI
ncbi:hypothetical protein J7E50_17970 [Pedobacter sp. ISL-68]|uniref:DUF6922 domain-containing protein n=1 Tax=unclassified Pedobacter TaxID=2628915 RepID=UPI001BE9F385|nr:MULTISPECIES: hypothetical protein [unclassified Pedobacter]MBT2559811.1 hypothetical protein [Pedobacter sp. ISL-64]MBT2592116.1 hypothetical protein [Pedobacter sp. ISL-68]